MSKLAISFGNEKQIYVVALLTSIALSYLIGYRNAVINPDGICYLLSAQTVGSASFKDVMHLCPQSQWPFYSTLIYALVQISHLSYAAAAYLLNGLLTLISVVTFIKIIKELGGTSRVLWLAALVILFAHQFNNLRDNIIRDHGFWAFYLISFYLLLKYFREPKWTTALAWNASLAIATLFRIEGIIFLLAMPLISWFCMSYSFKERAKSFFILNLPLILIGMVLAAWQLSHPQETMQKLGRVSEVIHQLQNGFFILADRFHTSRVALIEHVLPAESTPDASIVLFMTLITWYLYNVMITLSWGYVALIIYAWISRAVVFTSKSAVVVYGYVIVNFIMTLGFLAEHLFISKRYLIAMALTMMVWVPFALNDLIKKWSCSLRLRILLSLVSLVVFMSALSGIFEFGQSKFYIRTAGNWVANNVPANATLYANDFQLMYYTQHFHTQIFEILPTYLKINTIAQGQWKNYDYLALRLRNKEVGEMAAVLQELNGIVPIQVFSNKRGNRVAIYKIEKNKILLEEKK